MYRHFVGVFTAVIALLANLEFLSGNQSTKTDRRTIRAEGGGEDFLYIFRGQILFVHADRWFPTQVTTRPILQTSNNERQFYISTIQSLLLLRAPSQIFSVLSAG